MQRDVDKFFQVGNNYFSPPDCKSQMNMVSKEMYSGLIRRLSTDHMIRVVHHSYFWMTLEQSPAFDMRILHISRVLKTKQEKTPRLWTLKKNVFTYNITIQKYLKCRNQMGGARLSSVLCNSMLIDYLHSLIFVHLI